ncbi:MAG TPA: hypothetical protein VJZ27_03675, partial [Aggregatilineales bacterium]|nr:hypothetical protein [Aggregatilineales bacterium]
MIKGLFLILLSLLTACGLFAFLFPVSTEITPLENDPALEVAPPVEAAPKWYFALANDEHQLVAFNAGGESHILLENEDAYSNRTQGTRLEPDRALFALETESGLFDFALLTSDNVMIFDLTESLRASLNIDDGFFASYAPPYALVALDPSPPTAQLLLFNTDSGEVTLLTDLASSAGFNPAGISADGRYVRYLAQESADSTTWNYTEYDTQSRESRIFYTVDERFAISSHTSDGSYWIYLYVDRDAEMRQFFLIQPNAEPELLYEHASDDRDAARTYTIQEEFIIIWNPACIENCELAVQSVDNRELIRRFPQPAMGLVSFVRSMDENRFLVLIDNTFWMLNTDGSATSLGAFDLSKTVTNSPPGMSPDRRWLLAVDSEDNPTTYRLRDLQNEHIIIENELTIFVQATFTDYGFIVNENQPDNPQYIYFEDDDSLTLLPAERRTYFDILPDGDVLYREAAEPESPAIYRYN